MNNLYSKKVIEYFRHPKNMGEIKNADGVATVGNPVCGDVMKITIKIAGSGKREAGSKKIADIKFQTLGCGAAIATSSVLTELAKGKTLKAAEKISKKDIVKALGGLPSNKLHCSLLAVDALKKAIADYRKKQG